MSTRLLHLMDALKTEHPEFVPSLIILAAAVRAGEWIASYQLVICPQCKETLTHCVLYVPLDEDVQVKAMTLWPDAAIVPATYQVDARKNKE